MDPGALVVGVVIVVVRGAVEQLRRIHGWSYRDKDEDEEGEGEKKERGKREGKRDGKREGEW